MNTERKHTQKTECVLFVCAALLFAVFIATECIYILQGEGYRLALLTRILGAIAVCLPLYFAAQIRHRRIHAPRTVRLALLACALLYLYLLLSFTLADPALGRGQLKGEENGRAYYLSHYVNTVPFRSIYTVYIRGFINGYVNSFYMLLNLLGNICAFMPFAFFLPCFFRKQKRWYLFLPTVLLAVSAIELLQFAFMVGSCDIDDLILNAGGAMLLFGLLKLPPLQKLTDKLTANS